MSTIISFFWIISFTGLIVMISRKPFEQCSIFSLILGTLFLYLFCFFNQMRLGYYLTYLPVIGFWIILLIRFFRKDKELRSFFDCYFTPGFFAFCVLFFVMSYLQKGRHFSGFDEFQHWGPMVMNTLKLNGFYSQPDSFLLVHKDYPPFFSLLETLWCGFGGFVYVEKYLYRALTTFLFSCLLPVFSFLKRRKEDILPALFLTVTIVLFGLTVSRTVTSDDFAYVYNSVYIDWALMLTCGAAFFFISFYQDYSFTELCFICLLMVSLLLQKQMGLPLYLLSLLYLFLNILVKKGFRLGLPFILKTVLTAVVIPAGLYLSWQSIIRLYQLTGQFRFSQISISSLSGIISGTSGEDWQHLSYTAFMDALLHRKIQYRPFPMTYVEYSLLLTVILLLAGKFSGHSIVTSSVFVFGAAAYAFAMLLLYVYSFGEIEGPAIAAYDRYMQSYLFFGNSLVLQSFYRTISEEKILPKGIFSFCFLLVIFLIGEPYYHRQMIHPPTDYEEEELYEGWGIYAECIPVESFRMIEEDAKVLCIEQLWQSEYCGDYLRAYYAKSGRQFDSLKIGTERMSLIEMRVFTPEEWHDFLLQYDYIYTVFVDQTVIDLWIAVSDDDLYNRSLYRISETDNGRIHFERVLWK